MLLSPCAIWAQDRQLLDRVDGERYESEVPDTLDLAERAKAALALMTSERTYLWGDLKTLRGKWAEAMPLLRLMSGHESHLEQDRKVLQDILHDWSQADAIGCLGGRELRGISYYQQICPDASMARQMAELTRYFSDNAIYKANADSNVEYAFYPLTYRKHLPVLNSIIAGNDPFIIIKDKRYPDMEEPPALMVTEPYHTDPDQRDDTEHDGHWLDSRFGIPMYYSAVMEGLYSTYKSTGDSGALRLLGLLTAFIDRPEYWVTPGELPSVRGGFHAHYRGHIHGHLALLRAILNYAEAAGDPKLKQFARDGYEYTRNFGCPKIGFIPEWTNNNCCETCSIADIIALAIRLSDFGAGDYWEDVDQYVRNQFAEQQVITPDNPAKPDTGYFVIAGFANYIEPRVAGCCTANGCQALYYAWEGIVRARGDHANINLLLNRASSWLDIDSHLPYEGKVVVRNKTMRGISVRIPMWVDRAALKLSVNENSSPATWSGNYLLLNDLKPGDLITIEFPMPTRTEHLKVTNEPELTYEFKGNNVVSVNPQPAQNGNMPIYANEKYRENHAPKHVVERYVAPKLVDW